MSAETIDHNTLSRLVEAGTVSAAHVIGQIGGWSILIEDEMLERPLVASRSKKIRTFKKLETLAAYLKGIGISRFDVDTAQYDPANVQIYSRPDRTETMKFVHEAASHDKWFREQVELALKEADAPNTVWIPHDIAKTNMQRQRENLLARIGKTE